ncbi:MAG: META domain-containing protein [gamma proteobacterium symbiont of Taylorina sp.]|nr:META domain-containing protein [gamma proteobacterium symbiont of Taylorina sp.]
MKLNFRLLFSMYLLVLNILFSCTSQAEPLSVNVANMTFHGIYDNQAVVLKNGEWSGTPFVKGGASRSRVGLINNFTFSGDLSGDGIEERVVFLWESSGGSGNRVYIAVLASHDGQIINQATYLLGDRVQLQKGSVKDGIIELNVIQAGKDDAACCPTNTILRSWSLSNNQLIENKALFLGILSLSDLENTLWLLSHMSRDEKIPKNINISMNINAGKVSGRSACNRYFAGIKTGEMSGDIVIGQPAGTRMACPDDIMKLENHYLDALSKVIKYSFLNGQLALTWKDKEVIHTMLFSDSEVTSQ